jgi:hypothetical protein
VNWLTTRSGAARLRARPLPVEDAQLVQFAGHDGGDLDCVPTRRVVAVDAEQHQQTGADLPDGRALDVHRGRTG